MIETAVTYLKTVCNWYYNPRLTEETDSKYFSSLVMRFHSYDTVICAQVRWQSSPEKLCNLVMAMEAWRAALGHHNPAELLWEYPAAGAQSIKRKYF